MKDESGAILGAAGYFVDVTESVRAGVTAAVSDFANSRAVIEQAKGVLIAAYGVSADDAFAILVQRSQDSNIKVKDIAGTTRRRAVRGLGQTADPGRRRLTHRGAQSAQFMNQSSVAVDAAIR